MVSGRAPDPGRCIDAKPCVWRLLECRGQLFLISRSRGSLGAGLLTLRRLPGVRTVVAACLMAAALATQAFGGNQSTSSEWPSYGNDPGGERYSPIDQINRGNVAQLKVAWIYHTGDVSDGSQTKRKTAFENTPIVVNGTMYLSTPFSRVVALDLRPAARNGPSIRISICRRAIRTD